MAVFDSPAKYAMHIRKRTHLVVSDMEKAHKFIAEAGKDTMHEQTGGPLKAATLRRMGHPYARNGATVQGAARGITSKKKFASPLKGQIKRSGMVSRLPINENTGKLRRAITLAGPTGSNRTYSLYANVPYAKHVLALGGTKYMVARGMLGPRGLLRKRHLALKHTMKDVLIKGHRKI